MSLIDRRTRRLMRLVPLYQGTYRYPLPLIVKAHQQCAEACQDCQREGVPWSPYLPPQPDRDAVREYDRHLYLEMA